MLHVGDGYKDGTITVFNMNTLELCKKILLVRNSKNLNGMYGGLKLPGKVDLTSGFHIECYRRFTALGKNMVALNQKEETKSNKSAYTTRSQTTELAPYSSSTGVLPKICIFCTKKDKKHNTKKHKLVRVQTDEFEKNVKTYAGWLKDTAMLAKLGDLDFVAKEIHYHGICRTKYQTKAERTQPKKQKSLSGTWRHARDVHAESFKSICNMIETQVIREKETVLMSEILSQ